MEGTTELALVRLELALFASMRLLVALSDAEQGAFDALADRERELLGRSIVLRDGEDHFLTADATREGEPLASVASGTTASQDL